MFRKMNFEPNLPSVYQAIQILYNSNDATGAKENASLWLGELQKSLYAWTVSDKLLHEKRNIESCYFAANTMRSKIQYYFHELPPTSYDSLKESLLTHLSTYDGASHGVIVTQLCLALADLYLQVPTWKDFLPEIFVKFGDKQESLIVLLELLKVVVEEVSSRRLRIGNNRREALSLEFAQQLKSVHEYLQKICESQSQNENVSVQVIKCLGAWLSFPGLNTSFLAQSSLLSAVFEVLKNPSSSSVMHDAATECVTQALYIVESYETHAELAQLLYQRVHELQPMFHASVACEDASKLENYCRIFTELAESVLYAIVDHPGDGLGSFSTLELLLICLGHHDYSLAEMTFNIWYRLSEYLYQRDFDGLTEVFRPYIERLFTALHRHCRFDSDHDGIPEDNTDFNEFRRKASEVIKDVVFIIGSTNCFKQMFSYMQQRATAAAWDEIEASLYILTTIAKNIIAEEDEIVPSVVDAVLNMPADAHLCIRYTSVKLLGELSHWINANHHYLERTFEFLLQCLKVPKLANVATQSLENICLACKDKMAPQLDSLMNLVTAIDQLNVEDQAVLGLLRATAVIMSNLRQEELIVKLNDLCSRQSQPLISLLRQPVNSNGNDAEAKKQRSLSRAHDPVVWLDRLAAIFRHLKVTSGNGCQHPCLGVITELWPLLLETCDRYQENERVIEHTCRTIRFAVRSLGVQCFPLLSSLVTKMLEIYQKRPHSCFLYLGGILVDEYGQYETFVPGLIQMLQEFVPPTFKIFAQPNALQNCPDVVDDLFRLCVRFVQRAPLSYFQCSAARPLFECALASLHLDHRDACQSVNKFLVEVIEFIDNSKKQPAALSGQPGAALALTNASQLLTDFGQVLVQNIVAAAIFHISTQLLRELAEVLFALSKLDNAILSTWLQAALQALPSNDPPKATPKQLEEFHENIVNASELKQVTNALRELARLFR